MDRQTFREFMLQRFQSGGFTTEDALTTLLPLFRETQQAHLAGFVAPLEGTLALHVSDSRAWFEQSARKEISRNEPKVKRLQQDNVSAFEVIDEFSSETDVDLGTREKENLSVGEFDETTERRVYLPGYVSWEHTIGHHDPLTDIFSLGILLASLVCHLDFDQDKDVAQFVANRNNLFALAPELHPVVARAIVRMTELDRHKRAQDFPSIISTLENYRDQETDIEFDLAAIEGFETQDHRTKQAVVLAKLQERLFDLSKRNRLLNFKQTMQSVNLTQASVPLSFNLQSLRPEQLLTWNKSLHKKVCSGKPLSLNSFLNFSEAIYLPGVLDRILAEARRDTAEFGMAQLRLAICFLNWSNLKEKPIQRFESPLLLVPVQLKKKKGLNDKYTIDVLETIAEVNPVLRHQFKELYEIELPESIDLEKTDVDQFYDFLAAHIENSRAGITLKKIEKPQVTIVHEKAKRRLDQYRRRARLSGRGMRNFMELDYSYDPANFHPLGVKIFANFVQPKSLKLREIIQKVPPPRKSFAEPTGSDSSSGDSNNENEKVEEVKKTFVQMEDGSENPYQWQFDLCNVTLANFKYRKMSLVRDYELLLKEQRDNTAFDAVFSLHSISENSQTNLTTPIDDRYDVVPCDPTQAGSIAKARAGESYIIQGPPGTGKSQTIANLIADYVARGKRVLFVCEKRAAIDVVYSRLKQRGLGTLCCLIHDSQTDKKEFVMDLKKSYHEFLDKKKKRKASPARKTVLKSMRKSLDSLEHFHQQMGTASEQTGVPLRQLLAKCLAAKGAVPELDAIEKEKLPDYRDWSENRSQLEELNELVAEIQSDEILANHPLCCLSPSVGEQDRPISFVKETTQLADDARAKATQQLRSCGVPNSQWQTVGQGSQLVEFGNRLLPHVQDDRLHLLDADSESSRKLETETAKLNAFEAKLQAHSETNSAWREKIPAKDLPAAIEQAKSFEGSYFFWLSPSWWRLRSVMKRCYDFKSHVIRPSWATVLNELSQEYKDQGELEKLKTDLAQEFKLSADLGQTLTAISETRQWLSEQPSGLQATFQSLLKSSQAATTVSQITDSSDAVNACLTHSGQIIDDCESLTWEQLETYLQQVENSLEEIPDFLACLKRMKDLPPTLRRSIRQFPLNFQQLETAIADATYDSHLQNDRELNRFNFSEHQAATNNLNDNYRKWLDANTHEILTRQRSVFMEHIELCENAATTLTPEEKAYKKRYQKGRRELEHEFGKSMRYKPIRDLMAEESGEVVNDLKPVWLMSPLSVSDTLPLRGNLVDVVIFDEASQVTLEEAIPTIFRAPQAIVVGDQMQLPPTNFFASKKSEEDEGLEFEEEGQWVQYDLNTNSLLSHSAKNLPSTMLGWHYRSRSESLISFSNRAFYNGRLLTVPDEALPAPKLKRISVEDLATDDFERRATEATSRPISFHFMEQGIYDNRRNRIEADYIANLVRELLRQNENQEQPYSIGVVAFSEAQQEAIEQALNRLAESDREFRALLDSELEREVDNQFVGLLVKNLENIQGDERDIIILSVCYGQNTAGKMYMNFGPINKSGGEKRLNVAFSRAKKNMCVVSSITGDRITNDYNDGARCLKNYLTYAEAVSVGDADNMAVVLQKLSRQESDDRTADASPLVEQISAALQSKGFEVDRNVGQSHFQCDLGVRKSGDQVYRLGILVDNAEYYRLDDVLERDVMRPRLLEAFGWRIAFVLAKDWYEDRERVLDRLLGELEEAVQ